MSRNEIIQYQNVLLHLKQWTVHKRGEEESTGRVERVRKRSARVKGMFYKKDKVREAKLRGFE